MLTALGPWQLRSSGAQCDRSLAVEVQHSAHRDPELAKRTGEKVGAKDWRGEGEGEGEEGGSAAVIK